MTTTLTKQVPAERMGTGSPSERFTSRDPAAFSIPSGREETWRFTPTRDIRAMFEPFIPTGELVGSVQAPAGVVAGPVPMTDAIVGQVLQPEDRVSALAFVGSTQAYAVRIPAEAVLDAPVVVSARGAAGNAYAHLVIEAGAYSKGTVVIDYSGSVTVAENVEIVLGDGAQLQVVSVQDWNDDAVQISAHSARIGRDAQLIHSVVNLGGRLVRISPTINFAGPGGSVKLSGISFAGPSQHFESRIYVDHSMPQCKSDVVYKNALSGQTSRTVWIGDVRIRPAATATETFELNRNLLLSDGARADSVPNLEIETGDIVSAGHASATGRFDDLQLFYLQSRGITEHEARRLVVRGFFADVVHRIGLPELEERLMNEIETRLSKTETENT
jgi:Fe-S cluster assembly protein SufD